MEPTLSYRREFSALGCLQAPKTVQYILTAAQVDGPALYGFQVIEEGPNHASCDSIDLFLPSRQEAELLLIYLYENGVPAVHCRAVVVDAHENLAYYTSARS